MTQQNSVNREMKVRDGTEQESIVELRRLLKVGDVWRMYIPHFSETLNVHVLKPCLLRIEEIPEPRQAGNLRCSLLAGTPPKQFTEDTELWNDMAQSGIVSEDAFFSPTATFLESYQPGDEEKTDVLTGQVNDGLDYVDQSYYGSEL